MTSFVVHDVHAMKVYGLTEIGFNLTWHISLELHLTEWRDVLILKCCGKATKSDSFLMIWGD